MGDEDHIDPMAEPEELVVDSAVEAAALKAIEQERFLSDFGPQFGLS